MELLHFFSTPPTILLTPPLVIHPHSLRLVFLFSHLLGVLKTCACFVCKLCICNVLKLSGTVENQLLKGAKEKCCV